MDAPRSETPGPTGCPVAGASMKIHGDETRLDPRIRNDPFPFYRALREQRPVYYDSGMDTWLVTRYEDAKTVLLDPITYSLEHGYQDRYANGFVDELAEIMNRDGGGFVRDIIACDPPAHTRLRRLIEKAFTAHRVKELEPRIREIVAGLIEPLAERGGGDAMKDIGAPLTARIICEQLGFDFEAVGTEKIARWTTAALAQIGRMQTHEEMLENARIMCEMQNYIIPVIRAREGEPREDMISDLVHARLDDEQSPTLSFAEKLSTIRALLIAGNDTTAAALANLMMILALQPEVAAQLHAAADDDRLLSRFVEEVLRLEPPVHGLFRTNMKEVELSGVVIPAYSQICVLFASANDDEAQFACPRTLDVARPNIGQHTTFGLGIHRCIGAALARMEIKVAAQEIIKRLDNIALAMPREEITYLPTLGTQTLTRLPVTFTRRA
jgi:cytochrome P450